MARGRGDFLVIQDSRRPETSPGQRCETGRGFCTIPTAVPQPTCPVLFLGACSELCPHDLDVFPYLLLILQDVLPRLRLPAGVLRCSLEDFTPSSSVSLGEPCLFINRYGCGPHQAVSREISRGKRHTGFTSKQRRFAVHPFYAGIMLGLVSRVRPRPSACLRICAIELSPAVCPSYIITPLTFLSAWAPGYVSWMSRWLSVCGTYSLTGFLLLPHHQVQVHVSAFSPSHALG